MTEVWRGYTTLTSREGQQAFVHTVRAVIDPAGQRVNALDRLYLAAAVPTLVVWGDHDCVIPVKHAYAAHETMPGSRLEILPGAGHFLPFEQPEWFSRILTDFLDSISPAVVSVEAMRELLQVGAVDDRVCRGAVAMGATFDDFSTTDSREVEDKPWGNLE